jgi:hypothetical protein
MKTTTFLLLVAFSVNPSPLTGQKFVGGPRLKCVQKEPNMKTIAIGFAYLLFALTLKPQKPQPQTAYRFEALTSDPTIGDYSLDSNAVIDATAINDAGEVAFIAHWAAGTAERSAVFTTKHIVASQGEVVGERTITSISPASLAINNAGQVAYEATYAEPSGSRTGIFVEKCFILELSGGGAADDFIFSNDGRVLPKPGIAVPPPPPVQTVSPAPAPTTPQSPGSPSGLHPKLSSKVWGRISKLSPIEIAPNTGSQTHATPPQQPAPTPRPAEPKPVAPMPAAPPVRICNPPAFPFPPEWQIGDDPGGVIASHLVEGQGKTRPYDSPLYGRINSPIRVTQFSADCRPLLIEISDAATRGRIEIWSPVGLVTYLQPSGFFIFNGLKQRVPPGAFTRAETTIRVNARGQIAIPVSLSPEGPAILVGTPINH